MTPAEMLFVNRSRVLTAEAERDAAMAAVARAESQKALDRQEWNRMHHAFKDCGIHPGRTDDDLCEVLKAAWQQRTEEIAAMQKAVNFWRTAYYEAREDKETQ